MLKEEEFKEGDKVWVEATFVKVCEDDNKLVIIRIDDRGIVVNKSDIIAHFPQAPTVPEQEKAELKKLDHLDLDDFDGAGLRALARTINLLTDAVKELQEKVK